MKKILLLALSVVLVFGIFGCNKKDDSIPTDEQLSGGWQVNMNNSLTSMPEEAATAWYGAVQDLTGAEYEPIALIGTQVVAGTNYMFLARETLVTKEPVVKLAAVVVYADLQGGSKMLSVKELDLGELTSKNNSGTEPNDGLAGGWTVFEDMDKMADVTDDEKATFEKALDGMIGVGYIPVTVLGTQVVAGENIAFLAKGTVTSEEPVTNAYVVSVYKDLEGGASLNNICVLNLSDFTE